MLMMNLKPFMIRFLMENDQYFVLRDFDSYVNIQKKVDQTYRNQEKWLKMSTTNIAQSGYFSSDRTIKEYATDIWKIYRALFLRATKLIGEHKIAFLR